MKSVLFTLLCLAADFMQRMGPFSFVVLDPITLGALTTLTVTVPIRGPLPQVVLKQILLFIAGMLK